MSKKKDYLASNTRIGILTICGVIFMSAILNPKDKIELLIGMAYMGLTLLAMMDVLKRKSKAKSAKIKKQNEKE